MSSVSVKVNKVAYTGKAIESGVIKTAKIGRRTLVEGEDYTVSYVNNTKAGTAKITFTGKGLYNGTFTKSFRINKAPLSENMLDNASKKIEMTYTGKALNPEVILKIGDKTLKKGTDYTLTYKNNVKVSTTDAPAQITVKGIGNYTGSFKVDFAVIAKSNGVDEKSNAKSIKSDEEDDNLTEDGAIVDEPTTDEPVTDETTEEEPVTDEPTEDEPVIDESTEDNLVTDEPTVDDLTSNEYIIADIDAETTSTIEITAQ